MHYYDYFNLTEREENILKLLTEGYDNSEIAEKMNVSLHTIKAHMGAILKKLQAKNRTHAVYKAVKDGFIR